MNAELLALNSPNHASAYPKYIGVIAGNVGEIYNSYVDLQNVNIYVDGFYHTYCGLIAGNVDTMLQNCCVKANIERYACIDEEDKVAGLLLGKGTANNCFVIVSGATDLEADIYSIGCRVTVYNCVVIGLDHSLMKTNKATSDRTNGLYALASGVEDLKTITTYTTNSGAGRYPYNWNTAGGTAGSAWDFTNTWTIKSAMNDGYPILKWAVNTYSIALNVTTNLSGSTTSFYFCKFYFF